MGYNPSYLDVYWGNVPEGQPAAPAAAPVRRPRPAPVDPDQMMREAIQKKIVYANVLGVPDPSMVNMEKLGRIGISAQRGPQGLPYGISSNDLSDEEKQWMVNQAYGAGMRERGEEPEPPLMGSPVVEAMRRGRR